MTNFREILQQSEGKNLEFKAVFPDAREGILKTCIAFANGAGGDLYIGISDRNRRVIGVEAGRIFEWEEQLANWVYTLIEPTIAYDFTTLHIDGKTIIHIRVPAGGLKPYHLRGKTPEQGTYIRVGSTNRLASPEMLAELHRQRRNLSFDMEEVHSLDFHHLQSQHFEAYWKASRKAVSLPQMTKDRWIKLGAARKTNGKTHPTVGGVLFFSDTLPEELSQATLQVTRFQGTTTEVIVDTKTFSPPLSQQVEQSLRFLSLYNEKGLSIRGVKHEVRYRYPLEALREAVINAICHRDYAATGSNIKIGIFDNRIEITNPGPLPGGLLLSDLGQGISELRNRLIARYLREMGYLEQLGTGIQRMQSACERHGIPLPHFQEIGLHFRVTFFRTFEQAGIDETESKILGLLTKKGKVQSGEISNWLGVHRNTATAKLKQLLIEGKIVKFGKGRLTHYQLP